MSTPTLQSALNGPGTESRICPPGPEARRITIHTDDAGMAIIKRAVTLKLALLGSIGADDRWLYGAALSSIVSEWLTAKSDELRSPKP